jgi:formyltetrahydrofolate deformylase
MPEADRIVLTLTCPDRMGIVHAVSGLLTQSGCNIEESQQFADTSTNRFFMRVDFSVPDAADKDAIREQFADLAQRFEMEIGLYETQMPPILVLVSRIGHCLNDLLYRHSTGSLHAQIAAVVSNHPDFESLVSAYGIPYHYLPVSNENRREQEKEIMRIADELGVSLLVLARYMQVLTPETVELLDGRAINIHHGLLPSFKGAQPYTQAYERGVKLIGATAHFVTSELDGGPIIEQEVSRVDHRSDPAELTAIGQDLECIALSRAVGWYLDHRVMRNGNKTVVFR